VTVAAVVVSRGDKAGLFAMLDNLAAQTRPPDSVLVYVADFSSVELAEVVDAYPDAVVHAHPAVDDWGHSARDRGIREAAGDWVGFFNSDDYYEPHYLERMLAALEESDADAVWCSWNENPEGGFCKYEATAGNFLVSLGLAKEIGWTGRHYEADGDFIDAVVASGAHCVKVSDLLYIHNP
jgi:glycosyltransferase involved in cell wall biosynthesis